MPPRRPHRGHEERSRFDHPALYYQPPKELRRFRTGLALMVSALLAFALWLGLWFATATYIKVQVKGWADANRERGIIASYGDMQMSGFPARVRITLSNPHFKGPFLGYPLGWQGQAVEIEARPWWPFSLHVNTPGNHQFDVPGLGKLSAQIDALSFQLAPGDGWAESLDLQAANVTVVGAARMRAARLRLTVQHDPKAPAGGNGLRVWGELQDAQIPSQWTPGLSGAIQMASLSARVTGQVRPGPLRERLPAWAQGGGAVEVESLKLRARNLGLVTSGTVALNSELQPIASFSAKFEGLFKVLEILRVQGYLSGPDVITATMNLAALSKRPQNGGASSINLSVTVQDGQVSLGGEKILDFAPIGWGLPVEPEPESNSGAEAKPVRDYKDVPPIF